MSGLYQGFDPTFSILELDIGMICACLLAFPAFIDRYGPGLLNRLRSYSNLRRSAARGILALNEQGRSSANGKVFRYGSDEYVKLAGRNSATVMRDIGPETSEPSDHSPHTAKLNHEDSFQSLRSPQALASAHIV